MTEEEQPKSNNPLWFHRLKRKVIRRTIYAFDIEGSGVEGGFVCGAIAGEATHAFYTEPEAMWKHLLELGSEGAWLYAHNLEYDLPIVAGKELFKGKLLFKSSGMLWGDFKHRGKRVRFLDSSNLFPHWPVARIGKVLGYPKLEVPEDIIYQLSNGARWSNFSPEDQALIRSYCLRDAEIVARGVLMLQEQTLDLGGELKPTLAGISMDVYRRTFHKWAWKVLPEDINNYLRPSFYGGRVENFVYGKVENANLYDINSLYPYILETARFPHPNHIRMLEGTQARRCLDQYEGVVCATVETMPCHIPILPHRISGKLFFPTGTTTALWTTSELRYSLCHDAKLIDLHWLVGTDVLFNPFYDFIEDLYKARQVFQQTNDPRHELIKLIMNSLYGRFGLNPGKGLFQVMLCPDEVKWEDYQGWTTTEINGELVLVGPINFKNYPAYANVMFAALVSSGGRIELHKALLKCGENSLYCDTDSILTTNRMKTGDKLGEWKSLMKKGKADLLGPKEYALYHGDGKHEYKAKGVPSRAQREYVTTGTARFSRAIKIREAMKRGLNPSEWVQVKKEHHPILPKRRPLLPPSEWTTSYCQTVPWSLDDLQQALSVSVKTHFQDAASLSSTPLPEWIAPVFVRS